MPATADRATGTDELAACVWRWIAAFNARDEAALLRCVDAQVEIHPIRLRGVEHVYRGHAGIRRWMTTLREADYRHRLAISETRPFGADGIFAVGAVDLPGQPAAAPFWGMYRVAAGGVFSVRHSLTDGDLPELLGWLT